MGHQITISPAQLRQRFHGCTPDYIRDVCHSSCCNAPTKPTGMFVAITPREQSVIEDAGGVVVDHLLQPRPGERVCPFKTDAFLCGLHGTDVKPFGCVASPFTLTSRDTLIVRNRYRLLRCYRDDRDGPAPPAYIAFRGALDHIFGIPESRHICDRMDNGAVDPFTVHMSDGTYENMTDNTINRKAS